MKVIILKDGTGSPSQRDMIASITHRRCYIKTSPNCLLSVRVIRARNISSKDLFTASDCYVSLWLPTASNKKVKTKTIEKTDNPVWNETFYFRIQNEVQNILELTVYDEDSLTKDDEQFTVLFDVAKVRPGEVIYKIFSLKSEKEDSLEVEFKMETIPGPPEKLITNGVLVSREVCCLEVQVDKEENKKYLKENKNVVLTVDASYEGTQKTTMDSDTFLFHCIKSWEPVLKARLQNEDNSDDSLTIPLTLLGVGQKVKVGLPVEKGTQLELQVQVNDCPENLDVRLGYNLCEEEQDFLQKRKKVVASALKKVLQLRRDLHEHEIPVIAVMATGGSIRAMSAMYGHLLGLQKLNLLDCATYLTGTSGSTWTMTNLYKNTDWSQKTLEGLITLAKKQVMKCKMNVISMEHLKYYHEEMIKRAKEGHISSFTELWSLVQEAFLHDEPEESKLSDQRKAVDQGQNPLPLYAILNVKAEQISTFKFREWVEFSPYEVGFQKYGASIRSENFDSEFFMGRLVKKLPESRICFLEGIWTNIFTRNLLDGLFWSSDSDEFWDHWAKDMTDMARENNASDDSSIIIKPSCSTSGKLCEIFNDILTIRPLLEETHNFLRGLEFYKDYLQQRGFIEWKECRQEDEVDPCAPPSSLQVLAPTCPTLAAIVPSALLAVADPSAAVVSWIQEKHLCLIDVGYFINTSCPPLLKPERNVDVIISLDYSMGNVFQQLEVTYRYCKTQGIPFPKIELSEEDKKNPKECYVFSEAENPRAPIVLHFPLVNNTFKDYKEPGVKRSPLEMKDGDINLTNSNSPYYFTKLMYSAEDFDKLVNLTSYNIHNNKDLILQSIQRAMEWRRTKTDGHCAAGRAAPLPMGKPCLRGVTAKSIAEMILVTSWNDSMFFHFCTVIPQSATHNSNGKLCAFKLSQLYTMVSTAPFF
ncbi:Cytosolic phospholipase A2 beta [Chelonia mydas]|uniref:Phospholipase A2 n=1 Tax=Chelonia mydas TaxID=8469 RepID=M7BQV2_CHEMY|nr:Cytosolic phospholipase A2 beta [Chelonia mydas]